MTPTVTAPEVLVVAKSLVVRSKSRDPQPFQIVHFLSRRTMIENLSAECAMPVLLNGIAEVIVSLGEIKVRIPTRGQRGALMLAHITLKIDSIQKQVDDHDIKSPFSRKISPSERTIRRECRARPV